MGIAGSKAGMEVQEVPYEDYCCLGFRVQGLGFRGGLYTGYPSSTRFPFFFNFGVLLLKLSSRIKGTLITKGLLGNLVQGPWWLFWRLHYGYNL